MTYDVNKLSFRKRRLLLNNSNIPHRFLGMDASDVEAHTGSWSPKIDAWIKAVIDGKVVRSIGNLGVNGVGLLFDGEAGLGKTTHSVLCLTELVRRMPDDDAAFRKVFKYSTEDFNPSTRLVYYMTVPDFINRKKALIDADHETRKELSLQLEGFHGRSPLDHLNVRVLVLDDLGKELSTEYNAAGFDELLRTRYDKGLPTIVTTNLEREQWESKYGKAMGSFVFEAFKRVIIGTKDLRRAK